jgi:Ni/Co efflux regulator RcnB
MSMKKLLVVVALGALVAAPAFAQQAPNARQQTGASHVQRSSSVYGYERNGNVNPDFQLGGSRWKTNKAKHTKHHASASQK